MYHHAFVGVTVGVLHMCSELTMFCLSSAVCSARGYPSMACLHPLSVREVRLLFLGSYPTIVPLLIPRLFLDLFCNLFHRESPPTIHKNTRPVPPSHTDNPTINNVSV
jgi:hypothetical protein